jgi:hypothetical protein
MSEQAVVISVGDLQDVIDILESGRTWDAVGTLARVLSSGVKVELDIECADIFFDDRDRWVAVPSTEDAP